MSVKVPLDEQFTISICDSYPNNPNVSILVTLLLLGVTCATTAKTQTPTIPEAVILACNSSAEASNFPECLKEGALALEFLDAARSNDYYGASADLVLAACAERNDTYASQWVCFREAADKAVETRDLIGLDSIADACVAAISDPLIFDSIMSEYRERRAERFPDEIISGFSSYYPFQGCSD